MDYNTLLGLVGAIDDHFDSLKHASELSFQKITDSDAENAAKKFGEIRKEFVTLCKKISNARNGLIKKGKELQL